MKNDRFIAYLTEYYEENKTINNISRNAIVVYQGSPLKIGEFLANIRKQHKLYMSGNNSRSSMSKTALKRYKVLDSLSFTWEPEKQRQEALTQNDVCMIFIEEYYKTHKTLKDIPDTFTIDGRKYNIKSFFSHIRANHKKYIANQNSKGSNSQTALRRYKALDKMGFDWEPLETKKAEYETDDIYIRFLETYYQEHENLENLPKEVIYEGKKLNIENFITDRRKKHQLSLINTKYKPSELELTRWKKLEDMHFDWTPSQTKHQEKMMNDKCIAYLKYHYQKYGTINNIKADEIVLFKGEQLKIGDFINDMRKKYLAYQDNKNTPGTATELMLKRYKELEEMSFDWRPSESRETLADIARSNGINEQKLRKYVTIFNGDIEKSIKICKGITKQNSNTPARKKSRITINQEYEVNLPILSSLLTKQPTIAHRPTSILMYDSTKNLRQYCLDNGLNYTVIQKAIKQEINNNPNANIKTIIDRCIAEYKKYGQRKPITWVYSKYEEKVLVNHLLISINLDAEAILNDMETNSIDIFKAIENNCLNRNCPQQYNYLDFIYRDVIKFYNIAWKNESDKEIITQLTTDYIQDLSKEYHLNSNELSIIKSSFEQYSYAERQYKLFNVAFEKDEDKRIKKIKQYKLNKSEIEESLFIPLKFDNKVLIGPDSNKYKRRILLKGITLNWSRMSEEEKTETITQSNLSTEEITYIKTTSQTLDTIKKKVLKKH